MEKYPIKGIQPNNKAELVYVVMFISSLDPTNKSAQNRITERIFKERTPQPSDKFTFNNLSGFFLNLDNKNQLAFMLDCGFDANLLLLPAIENWEDCGKEVGMNDWIEPFTQEDVRCIGSMFFNEWDLYPHALVWIRRFLLFAGNNSIPDKEYKGKKFGNYPNWAEYFMQLSLDKKKEFTETLINYM